MNFLSISYSNKNSKISVDVALRRNTESKNKIYILDLRNKNQSLRNINQKYEKGNIAETLNIANINKK